MPRVARSFLPGSYFHIMVQGINKEYIFKSKEWKEKYKQIIKSKAIEYHILIIAYCIMENHTHMLVYVNQISDMTKFMQKLNTTFAIYYNKKNDRVGFVFRDRYKTQTIKDEKHLYNCIAYIHKNPVKAKIVESEKNYRYSSYNEFINEDIRDVLQDEAVELVFGSCEFKKFADSFYMIHNENNDEDFIEEIDNIDYNQVVKELKLQNKTTCDIIVELQNKYRLSTRTIAELLGITRYQVMKNLKNK